MFEDEYCPNCDNYIRQIEGENAEMRKAIAEAHKLWSSGGKMVGVMGKLMEIAKNEHTDD